MLNITNHPLGNANPNHSEVSPPPATCHLPEWLLSTETMVRMCRKAAQHAAGGNVDWYIHLENSTEVSSIFF
jgi:hypothetical protein